MPAGGWLNALRADYTLMMFVINVLTFKMTTIIIDAIELAKPGETHPPNPLKPP